MKITDIKNHLASVLPVYTDLLTKNIDIESLTFNKDTGMVVAVCKTPHGLKNGNTITITNAEFLTPIESITTYQENSYLATTSIDHDLTEGWQAQVSISDTTNFNGEFNLLEVLNRRQFIFESPTGFASEASGILKENRLGYNGAFSVLIVDDLTFEYKPLVGDLSDSATGEIKAKTKPRIMGLESTEDLAEIIERQIINEPTVMIMIGNVDANQDAEMTYDVAALNTNGSAYKQLIIENLHIAYVFPKNNNITGVNAIDSCDELRAALCKTLCGYVPSSNFIGSMAYSITYSGDSTAFSDKAFYVREFNFQKLTGMSQEDIYQENGTRAFRDVNLSFTNKDLYTIIDLDKEEFNP